MQQTATEAKEAPSDLATQLEAKDKTIQEQQKKISTLEEELSRSRKQIEDMLNQITILKEKSKSEGGYKPPQSRYWTAEEHDRFLDAIKRFGTKDVKSISSYVGTRNSTQVRTHAQKYFLRLDREKKKQSGYPSSTDEKDHRRDSMEDDSPISSPLTADSDYERGKKKTISPKIKRRQSLPPETSFKTEPSRMSIPQQLAAETSESVLSIMKGWTQPEYNLFVEGLVAFSDEKDMNKKCSLICEKYLPKRSPEEVRNCYIVLQNVARAKEADDYQLSSSPMMGDMAKRQRIMEPLHGHSYGPYGQSGYGQMHGAAPDSMAQRNYPYGYRYPAYPANVPGYPPVNPAEASPYYHNGYSGGYGPNDVRRASYPLDPFSVNKANEVGSGEYSEPSPYYQNGDPASHWDGGHPHHHPHHHAAHMHHPVAAEQDYHIEASQK